MNKLLLALAFIFCLSMNVYAETLKGGHVGCLTEKTFDQIIQASVKNDELGFNYLIKSGKCIITKYGIKVSVLKRTWTGRVKVRAYSGDQAVEFWTPMENIEKD